MNKETRKVSSSTVLYHIMFVLELNPPKYCPYRHNVSAYVPSHNFFLLSEKASDESTSYMD